MENKLNHFTNFYKVSLEIIDVIFELMKNLK